MMFTWQHTLVMAVCVFLLVRFLIHFIFVPKLRLPQYYGIGMLFLMLLMTYYTDLMRTQFFSMDTNQAFIIQTLRLVPLIIVLFLYFLFFSLIKEFEYKKLTAQKLDMQKIHLVESTETYSSILRIRHELKNHIFYMNSLLSQGKYDELKDYFNKLYRQEYAINMIESGNNVIDALLNQKITYAKTKNIRVSIAAALPRTIDIDESSVCIILSNLFDNAVEACEQMTTPEVSVTIRQKGKYVYIACKNTVNCDILRENPTLMTTKKAPHHGMGLQVIKSVVEACDGMIDFHMEDMHFIVNVMLGISGNKMGEKQPELQQAAQSK